MNPYNQTDPKKEQVREMFDGIAPKYDMLNHLLSLGVDRCWRNRVVRMLRKESPKNILDLATGTGDLAILMARKIKDCSVEAVDLSPQMLKIAEVKIRERQLEDRIKVSVGEAEKLDFEEGVFDAATVAFGVRNFHNLELGINQMYKVLRPGGTICILEFSTPKNKIFGTLYRFYFHNVLPRVGGWFSKDAKAYKYLPESVDEFPAPKEFCDMLSRIGFTNNVPVSLFGGVAYIYKAKK